ncbi:MAG: hypothetical protein GXO69_09595 [Acidobacteria bacterium]|nr:hypothetical protein [Acidobacteriota bacterium]
MNLLNALTEQEKSYFLLLNSMRKQNPNEKEFSFVKTIVQFSSSPILLSLIISCPKWYHTVEIKEALSENDVIPSNFNSYLHKVLGVIDVFRELGTTDSKTRSELMAEAKNEISSLRETDREFLKRLISGKVEYGPCDEPDEDFELRVEHTHHELFLTDQSFSFTEMTAEEKLLKARNSTDSKELQALLWDGHPEICKTAIQNRYLADAELFTAARQLENPETLKTIYNFPRWFFKDETRSQLLDNPALPADIRSAIQISREIISLFEKLSKLKHNVGERNSTAIEIAEKLKQVPELELQYITVAVKRKWPSLLSIIKAFYHFSQKRSASGQPAEIVFEETEKLSSGSINQLIQIAATSKDEKEIAVLLQHQNLNVFRNLLQNPTLTESMLGSVIHTMGSDKLLILEHSRWGKLHSIQNRMIHNPNMPGDKTLVIVSQLKTMKDLLDVLRDKKIKSVEVKNQAFSQLSRQFSQLPLAEKVSTILDTNGEIFRELWGIIFRDEELLQALVESKSASPEILSRIIHSRLTPLSVLGRIIELKLCLDNPGVVLEFFNNPKVNPDLLTALTDAVDNKMREHLKSRGLIHGK